MASQPRSGTVESYVKWAVEHGRSIVDIVTGSQSKFPYGNMQKVASYITKWAGISGKQPSVATPTQLTDKQRAQLLKSGYTPGINRITLDVTWISPRTGETIDGTWYVDVPDGISGNAMRSYAINQMYARFNQAYGGNAATFAEAAQLVLSISIRS